MTYLTASKGTKLGVHDMQQALRKAVTDCNTQEFLNSSG